MNERMSSDEAYSEAMKMQGMVEKGEAADYDEALKLITELSEALPPEKKGKFAALVEALGRSLLDPIKNTVNSAHESVFAGPAAEHQAKVQEQIRRADEEWSKLKGAVGEAGPTARFDEDGKPVTKTGDFFMPKRDRSFRAGSVGSPPKIASGQKLDGGSTSHRIGPNDPRY